MTGLIVKLFIKHSGDEGDPAVRAAYGAVAGALGILFNLFLFAVKLLAGLLSGAISIVADAFNNLTDAGSSLITLVGFRMSGQRPDKDHPFGHGRIEYLSGLLVSVVILLIGFELGKSSVERIFAPVAVELGTLTVLILSLSVLVKAYMALEGFRVGRRIASAALRATALDSLSDCVATATVLLGLVISHLTGVNIDAYCGLAVSVFILVSGLRAAKETVDPLLGAPPDGAYIARITELVTAHDEVLGMHDLIVHDYGPGRRMISLHAEVSADANLLVTHDLIDNIERELGAEMGCDAVIHMDPIAPEDEETRALHERVEELVRALDARLSIHDFRVVRGPTHTNLVFDLLVPHEVKSADEELRAAVAAAVSAMDERYYTVLHIDRAYL